MLVSSMFSISLVLENLLWVIITRDCVVKGELLAECLNLIQSEHFFLLTSSLKQAIGVCSYNKMVCFWLYVVSTVFQFFNSDSSQIHVS